MIADRSRWQEDGDGFWVAFRTKDRVEATRLSQEMDGKPYTVTAKPEGKRRSLDANAYCWVLLDRLAGTLEQTKETLYLEYIKKVGVFRDFNLTPEEAATFQVAWSRLGTGWPTEQVDFTPDGERLVIRAYYGSSTYNTKRMARLIDLIAEDCKAQGIETKTPDELSLLMARWGDG